MEIVKKIGMWLALICMVVIKIPIMLVQFIVNSVCTLIILGCHKLIKKIGDENVISGWNLAMEVNTNQAIDLECMFEDMEIEV
jgi:hypothetical protein